MRRRTISASVIAFLSAFGLVIAQPSTPTPGSDYCDYPCGYSGGTWGPQYTRMIVVGTCTTKVKLRMLTCMENGQVVTLALRIDGVESNCPVSNARVLTWRVINEFDGYYGSIPQGYFVDLLGAYPTASSLRLYLPSCMRVCRKVEVLSMPESPQTAATVRYSTFQCGTDCCILAYVRKQDGCLIRVGMDHARTTGPADQCYYYDIHSCPEGWEEVPPKREPHDCLYVCTPE